MKLPIIFFLILLLPVKSFFAQTDKEKKAEEKAEQGFELESKGKFEEAIKLFEEAQKLDKESVIYPYEVAFCLMQMKKYKKAIQVAEKLTSHKKTEDVVYQLIGNAYDMSGKPEKAIEAYEAGLKKFPDSGPLYLEMGNMKLMKEDYSSALIFYEKGIEAAPKFPSNYYWAAKIYCNSTEEMWGMIYGEIFMNLERNTKRTAEISELLYTVYKSEIKFTSDTTTTVSFNQQMQINVNSSDPKNFKIPYGMIYETSMSIAVALEKVIDLNSLDRIRTKFIKYYFDTEDNKKHPNVLFDYQNEMLKSGYLEAYNHWILMKGDEDAFTIWQTANKDKWDNFAKWFSSNPLQIDETHKFNRMQYL